MIKWLFPWIFIQWIDEEAKLTNSSSFPTSPTTDSAHFTFAIASYTAVIGHNLLVLDLLYLVDNSLSLYVIALQSASNHHAFWLKSGRELSQITRWYDLSYVQGAYMFLPYHEEHETKSEIEKEETKKAATFLSQPYIGSRI